MAVNTVRRAPLRPGSPTPTRSVPASIARPEYVGKPAPARNTASFVQSAETIEKMRVAAGSGGPGDGGGRQGGRARGDH